MLTKFATSYICIIRVIIILLNFNNSGLRDSNKTQLLNSLRLALFEDEADGGLVDFVE